MPVKTYYTIGVDGVGRAARRRASLSTQFIIGVDEVGRGPIAGPVAVVAFSLPQTKGDGRKVHNKLRGIRDSKQLSEKQREWWFNQLNQLRKRGLIDWRMSFVTPKRIDKIGISKSLRIATRNALTSLAVGPPKMCLVLLDGGLKAPGKWVNQKTIVRGDEKEKAIASASVVAKVLRDRQMTRYARMYPRYGFEKNKGYGTREHLLAIRKFGITDLHRRSFLQK